MPYLMLPRNIGTLKPSKKLTKGKVGNGRRRAHTQDTAVTLSICPSGRNPESERTQVRPLKRSARHLMLDYAATTRLVRKYRAPHT